MGVEKLGAGLGVSAADARHLKSRFLEAFPGLGRYIDELKRQYERYEELDRKLAKFDTVPSHIKGLTPQYTMLSLSLIHI